MDFANNDLDPSVSSCTFIVFVEISLQFLRRMMLCQEGLNLDP